VSFGWIYKFKNLGAKFMPGLFMTGLFGTQYLLANLKKCSYGTESHDEEAYAAGRAP
jgi:hypothetical protein